MIGGSLARRYARALLDIGRDERNLRRVLGEVEAFASLLAEVPALKETLEASHVNRGEKHTALDGVLASADYLPTTRNFLALLIDKDRVGVLPQIVAELRRMVEEQEGIERAEVVVPMPMSATQRDLLKIVLERQTGKKVELEERTEPAVLGGMVVRMGSTVYDGSLRTQIRMIQEKLEKG